MAVALISSPLKALNCSIQLPASKSISNRALIIQHLCPAAFSIHNLSKADDTQLLHEALQQIKKNEQKINLGHAGTSLRFMLALLAGTSGTWQLSGSPRLHQRPIKDLVEALLNLGADIQYHDKDGFPPLTINGKKLKGGKLAIDSSVSSQFISALLLIAPSLENGLEIELLGPQISFPYIQMTLDMMEYFGVSHQWLSTNTIVVKSQAYQAKNLVVESDWSAASYWYLSAALSTNAQIFLPNLCAKSWQGDKITSILMQNFNIKSSFDDEGVLIEKKTKTEIKSFQFDFSNCPDLAQTFACLAAGVKIDADLYGLQTLPGKESNRILALYNELSKINVKAESDFKSSLHIKQSSIHSSVPVSTYHDHRMAMAFAPLALCTGKISIENPQVVSKSYPGFWNDLSSAGFQIEFA